jgi:hypothetical protein
MGGGVRVLGVVLLGLAGALVAALDRDSHSASDTLNRAAPSLSLWLALALRLRAVPVPERSAG